MINKENIVRDILRRKTCEMCECTTPFFIPDKTVNYDKIKQVTPEIVALFQEKTNE